MVTRAPVKASVYSASNICWSLVYAWLSPCVLIFGCDLLILHIVYASIDYVSWHCRSEVVQFGTEIDYTVSVPAVEGWRHDVAERCEA